MADLDQVQIGETITFSSGQLNEFKPVESAQVGDYVQFSSDELNDFEPVAKISNTDTYFRQETGGNISGELGLGAEELGFLDDTQNNTISVGGFTGFVNTGKADIKALGRGVKAFIAATPQIEAGLRLETAEEFQEELKKPLGFADPFRLFIPLTASVGEQRAIQTKISDFLGIGTKEKGLNKAKNLKKSAQFLIDKNRRYLQEHNLVRPEGAEGVFFDIGSTGASIFSSIGLSLVTRSPNAAAMAFGINQKSNAYIEAREKDFSVEAASNISDVLGLLEGGLEFIGVNQFLKASQSSKGVRLVLFRTLEEAAQEASQQAAEEIVTQITGLRELDVSGGVGRIAYAAALGSLGGASVASTIEVAKSIAKEENISKGTAEAIVKKVQDNNEIIGAELNKIILDEASPIKTDKKSETEVAKIISDFQAGIDIDITQLPPSDRQEVEDTIKEVKLVSAVGKAEKRIEERAKEEEIKLEEKQVSQRVKSLENEASKIKTQLDKAEKPETVNTLNRQLTKVNKELDSLIVEQEKIGLRKTALSVAQVKQEQRKSTERVQTAFKEGVRAAKRDVKTAQETLIKIIDDSNIRAEDKAKFIKTIKNVQTFAQLEKAAPKVQERVIDLLNAESLRKIKGTLNKELSKKSIKVKRQAGKPVGKFEPDTQERLDMLSAFNSLTQEQAAEELNKRISENIIDPLINKILSLKAQPANNDASDVAEILAEVRIIKEFGKAIAEQRKKGIDQRAKELSDNYIELVDGDVQKDTAISAIFRGLNNTFLAQSGAWRQKIKYAIRSKDKKATEDFLAKVSLTKESGEFEVGKQDQTRKFIDAVLKRTGFKTEKQLLKKFQRDSQEFVINDLFTFSDGKRRRLKMTRSEARKRVMEFTDPLLFESMQEPKGNAYTEEIIQTIRDSLNDTDTQIMNAQLEFYDKYYDRINEKYKKIYGVNLPKIEFYSPIKREFAGEEVDEFLSGIQYRGGVAPSSLKSRKPNIRPISQQGDLDVFYSHMNEMEYFIAFAESVIVLQKAFKGADIQKAISDSVGSDILGTINKDLDWFANKGVRDSIAGEKMLRTLARNFSLSQLAAKPQIGLKQLTSLFAYAGDVKTADFVEGIAVFVSNPKKALKILNESNTFATRGISIDKDFQEMLNDKSFLNILGKNPTLTKYLMLPIRYGDKGAISIGGFAYYHALIKSGKTPEQALAAFDRKTSETQQSTNPDQMSELQRSNGIVRLLTQFMSSPNALMRGEYEALLDGVRGRDSKAETAKKLLIFHIIIPSVFQLAANGFQWDNEDQLRASILGSLNGILLWGDVLEATVSFAIDGEFFEPEIRHPADFVTPMLQAIASYDSDDVSLDDFVDGIKSIEKALDGTGKLLGLPLKTLYNDIIGATKGIEARNSDDVLEAGALLLGYSPYIIDEKILGE